MSIHELAGRPATEASLLDVEELLEAYQTQTPDPSKPGERVSFGTSGHRGSSLDTTFNEHHILAIAQAIAEYRAQAGIEGPLFLGMDTHALSAPAHATCLEVLAAHKIEVRIAANDGVTPTPAVSHAILTHNDENPDQADGIVITPSHNPPSDGGIKYNAPTGGPAGPDVTSWIEDRANEILENELQAVDRIPYDEATTAPTTRTYDYVDTYVSALNDVIDMEAIRTSGLSFAVDPLGGAGVDYWPAIAEAYDLPLDVLRTEVDSTFKFMTLDWDGKIRMDPSSEHAMQSLLELKDQYDVTFACDTDHDRHGIVTASGGLMSPNHYLCVAVDMLLDERDNWGKDLAVGKTVVTTSLIDRVAEKHGRDVYEVPVGFKWFVDVLLEERCCFVGEESAGASFLRRDGSVWTTDKDGIIACLLAAEITAKTGQDPSERYEALTDDLGAPIFERKDAPATPDQKAALKALSPDQVTQDEIAGDPITSIRTNAPGNDAPIGGLKVETQNGWFVARPSGTEAIYKLYAESFKGEAHLAKLHEEAQALVNEAFEASSKVSP